MAIEYRTEPEYIEYLDGVAYPKVSPRRVHGILQFQLGFLLVQCGARQFGEVTTEQDAVIGKRDGTHSKLIPDVSLSLYSQFEGLNEDDTDEPPFSPVIAIEVWSRGDSKEYLAKKFARFLKTGSQLVLDVRPKDRTVMAHTADAVTTFVSGQCFSNDIFPWFTFQIDELFGVLDALPAHLRERE